MSLGSGFRYIIVFLVIIITSGMLFTNGVFNNGANSIPQNAQQAVNLQDVQPGGAKDTLQLKGLKGTLIPTPTVAPSLPPNPTPTPTLTPINSCNADNGIPIPLDNGQPACNCFDMVLHCVNHKCTEMWNKTSKTFVACQQSNDLTYYDPYCNNRYFAPSDGIYCIAKPVLYLYPTKKTLVDVSIETSGQIVISDPLYPKNGWKNVLAYPDGTLIYQGKKYSELFYESDVTDITKPTKGIYIAKSNLNAELAKIITLLGLKNGEKQEFLDYWLPRLNSINSKYIFFSVLESKEKERVDKVNISPKPDTFIAFIAYFKGVDTKTPIEPLILPDNPPQRVGFTAVEWGGTIATE